MFFLTEDGGGVSIELMIFATAGMCFLIVLIVFLLRRHWERTEETARGRSAGGGVPEETIKTQKELIPIRYYEEKGGYYVLRDGTTMDLLRVQSKDLVNMAADDVRYDDARLSRWYRTYVGDVKLLSLNFPADTQEQQNYLSRKLEQTNDPQKKYWIERRLQEEIWLQKNKTVREYYIIFFSDGADGHEKDKRAIMAALQPGAGGLVEEVDAGQKHRVMNSLNNKYIVLR